MGYAICMGTCASCSQTFGFNPVRVPSVTVRGKKEPICQKCVDWANPIRREKGIPEIKVLPGAYEPMDEHELPND